MIPLVSQLTIHTAMRKFDRELRSSPDWANWEDRKNHKYAIKEDGRNYPIKQIISMATGVPVADFSGGRGSSQANAYARKLGFQVVDLPHGQASQRNPDWTRDQIIVALDFYLKHRDKIPGESSVAIRDLSNTIRAIGAAIGHKVEGTYRNENGVYKKLMNFCSIDPEYIANGRVGLPGASQNDRAVWNRFADDPDECASVAAAIVKELEHFATDTDHADDLEDYKAEEGTILARAHRRRERNPTLVKKKKAQARKKWGALICEVCTFNFAAIYGDRGSDFMECHHKTPLSTLNAPSETKLSDLALVCANCHRMIHAKADGLSVEGLRQLLTSQKQPD